MLSPLPKTQWEPANRWIGFDLLWDSYSVSHFLHSTIHFRLSACCHWFTDEENRSIPCCLLLKRKHWALWHKQCPADRMVIVIFNWRLASRVAVFRRILCEEPQGNKVQQQMLMETCTPMTNPSCIHYTIVHDYV